MTRTKTSKPPPAVRGAGRSHTLWTHALTAVLAAAAAAAASRHLSTAALASTHRLAASRSPVNESERLQTEDAPRYAEHLGSYSEYIIIGAGPGGMQLGAFMEDGGGSIDGAATPSCLSHIFILPPYHFRQVSTTGSWSVALALAPSGRHTLATTSSSR